MELNMPQKNPQPQAQAKVTVDEFRIRPLTQAEIQAVEDATRPEDGPDELDEFLSLFGL
jgi:hypothetical protein